MNESKSDSPTPTSTGAPPAAGLPHNDPRTTQEIQDHNARKNPEAFLNPVPTTTEAPETYPDADAAGNAFFSTVLASIHAMQLKEITYGKGLEPERWLIPGRLAFAIQKGSSSLSVLYYLGSFAEGLTFLKLSPAPPTVWALEPEELLGQTIIPAPRSNRRKGTRKKLLAAPGKASDPETDYCLFPCLEPWVKELGLIPNSQPYVIDAVNKMNDLLSKNPNSTEYNSLFKWLELAATAISPEPEDELISVLGVIPTEWPLDELATTNPELVPDIEHCLADTLPSALAAWRATISPHLHQNDPTSAQEDPEGSKKPAAKTRPGSTHTATRPGPTGTPNPSGGVATLKQPPLPGATTTTTARTGRTTTRPGPTTTTIRPGSTSPHHIDLTAPIPGATGFFRTPSAIYILIDSSF